MIRAKENVDFETKKSFKHRRKPDSIWKAPEEVMIMGVNEAYAKALQRSGGNPRLLLPAETQYSTEPATLYEERAVTYNRVNNTLTELKKSAVSMGDNKVKGEESPTAQGGVANSGSEQK